MSTNIGLLRLLSARVHCWVQPTMTAHVFVSVLGPIHSLILAHPVAFYGKLRKMPQIHLRFIQRYQSVLANSI